MPCGGLRTTGVLGGVWVQAPSLPRLPARWAGCWGPLATCCRRGCGCVRSVWCLCGACRGAWGCPSSVPLVPPSPVLCCGVVLVVCLQSPLPRARPSLGCWLPPVSSTVLSLFTLSSTLRRPALLPGMHVFPASAWCFSRSFSLPASLVLVPGSSSFSPAGSCQTGDGWGCGPSGGSMVRSGRVGMGTALHTSLVTFVRCFSRLFVAAWHVTYLHLSLLTHILSCFACCGGGTPVVPLCSLHLCLCVCALSSPFLSLHTMLLVRGGGGCVVLAATCLCGHAFRSPSVQRAGVGVGHPRVCGHTFLSFCQLMWRIPISQGQPMVPWTVRPNYCPNYCGSESPDVTALSETVNAKLVSLNPYPSKRWPHPLPD